MAFGPAPADQLRPVLRWSFTQFISDTLRQRDFVRINRGAPGGTTIARRIFGEKPPGFMLELGTGYGRWGLRTGLIAKLLGKTDVQIRLDGAEPQHAQWAREAIVANGLRSDDISIIEAAVAYGGMPDRFPFAYHNLNSRNCYGQAIGFGISDPRTGGTYFGRPVYETADGYSSIEVDTRTLEH